MNKVLNIMPFSITHFGWTPLFLGLALAAKPNIFFGKNIIAGASVKVITPKITETFTDANANGKFDPGEPYDDANGNGQLDAVWIAGFDNARPANAIHDDLFARCIVLSDGKTKIALVALDLIGFFHEEVQKVRTALKAAAPKSNFDLVVVASTHNHEGPDVLGLWGRDERSSGVDVGYLQYVREQIVAAIVEADQKLRPVNVRFAQAKTHGLINDGRLPLVSDDDILAMQFVDKQSGATVATLVNLSSHPEALGSQNLLITSDYPKYLRGEVERELGGTCVFFVGSIGGLLSALGVEIIDPQTGNQAEQETFRFAQLIGEATARTAIAALKKAPLSNVEMISFRRKEIFIPFGNERFRLGHSIGVLKREVYTEGKVDETKIQKEGIPFPVTAGRDLKTEVCVINFGEAQIVTVPGEIYPELINGGIQDPQDPGADFQGAVKEPPVRPQMTAKYKFIFGLANDEIGYIIPKSQWDTEPPFCYGRNSAQYGEINSVGPEAASVICRAIQELLRAKAP